MNPVKALFKINLVIGFTTLIGLVNNIVIAALFGLSGLLDAYFAACLIPNLFMGLVTDYLGKNFLPVFSKIVSKDSAKASYFTSSIVNIIFFVSTIITIFMVVFSKEIFSVLLPGFNQEEIGVVTQIFLIMSPVIVVRAVSKINEYVWQYNEKYTRVVIANAIPSIVLLGVLLLGKSSLGIYSLPIGFLLGNILLFVFLVPKVPYRYHLIINFKDKSIRSVFLNTGIMTISGLVTKFRPLIEKYFASQLTEGAISALSLANRLCMPLQQRTTVGLKMIVFTKSSKSMAKGKIEDFGNIYKATLVSLSFFIAPIVFSIGVNTEEVVRILFMRGNFNEEMSQLVALALVGLLPTVVFLSAVHILSNAFYVLNLIYIPALAGPAAMVVYSVALWILMNDYGVLGITLSVSIGAAFHFLTLTIMLSVKLKTFSFIDVVKSSIFYCVLSMGIFLLTKSVAVEVFRLDLFVFLFTASVGTSIYLIVLWMLDDWGFNYARLKFLEAFKKKQISYNNVK